VLLTLNLAHALSPIVMAWGHSGYRGVMLSRPTKFVGWPILIGCVSIGVAVVTVLLFPDRQLYHFALEDINLRDITNPLVWWVNVYILWNFYHAGAQNFGILCLYRHKSFIGWTKPLVLAFVVALTVLFGHEGGRIFVSLAAFNAGFFFISHWFQAIGMSAHVWGRHRGCSPLWFVGAVMIVGAVMATGIVFGMQSGVITLMITIASLRVGLGMWHFLQNGWVWKLSDPQVRATIGQAFA